MQPALAPAPTDDSVDIVTLGCRLNAAESEAMRLAAQEAALCNAVIVNTCAVTAEAVRQARQTIRRARRERPDATIIVTGCAAQIEPEMFAAMPEVDRVLGNAEKLTATGLRNEARVRVGDIFAQTTLTPRVIAGIAGRTRAYVQVQNGCDHRCTFCTIPYGRGNSRSAPAGDVIAQVRRLVETGCPEIVLTGVDLTSWGGDLPGQPSLGNLVSRILRLVPELRSLRLSSLDAIEMDAELFRLCAEEERVAPHLHLSLQHGADLILKRMKRRHLRTDAIALCARLKVARPEIALGADLIAGFPTETEAHFADSLSLVDEAQLSFLHVFPFSPRPHAPAARMPQHPPTLVKERAARLRAKGDEALRRHLDRWIGREGVALAERSSFARLGDFTGVLLNAPPPLEGEGVGGGVTSPTVASGYASLQSQPSSRDVLTPTPAPPPSRGRGAESLQAGASIRLRFTSHDGANLIGAPA